MVNAQLDGALRHLRGLRDAQSLTEAPDAQLLERFACGHEEAPFATLVRRHGPMVWSVSRRVLPHPQDAEDVFQATFLLLARKAESIRKAESVGSWLHGVAHRLALKTRLQQARRRSREKRAADMRQAKASGESPLSEVRAALDAALGELPEKYRAALVLCYLEGKTHEEAARHLGCPLATVRTRVARGRKLLRDRLANRGLTLSTAGLAALLIASAATAAAPAALVKAAVQAALPFAAGQPAAALCSRQAAGLVEGGLRTMFLTKVKTATALLLATCLVAGAAALTRRTAGDAAKPATSAKPPEAQAKPPAADEKDSVTYSGRVLGPDGRPVAGAKLYLSPAVGYLKRPSPAPEYGTTGADGRFEFAVSRAKFADPWAVVAASAANYGPGWANIREGGKRTDLKLQLVKDDVPITGRIVDLQGKPVRAATLTVLQINAAHGEDLGPWQTAARAKEGLAWDLEYRHLPRFTIALSPKVTVDADGRFRLSGIGRDRLVRVQLDGPTIASQQLTILTRTGKPIELTFSKGDREYGKPDVIATYYGAEFRHVAAPGRPVVGVVRDRDTKKPLAGVTIESDKLGSNPFHGVNLVQATTDAEGRYRLVGLPKGPGSKIMVIPDDDQPYLGVGKEVPDTPGLNPVTVDIELRRGIWIEGKLTDKATGQPRTGSVEYYAMSNNPHLRDYPGFSRPVIERRTAVAKADGTFRVVGMPGPGLLGVYYHRTPCLRADERDDEFGTKEKSLVTAPWYIGFTSNFNAIAPINPAKGVDPAKCDVTIDQGWTFTGTVLGPDGKPLAGARRLDLNSERGWVREPMKAAEFAGGFNPRRPREVVFLHPAKGLVGVAKPKENGGRFQVTMEPGAAVTGRLVDAEGKPRPGVELELSLRPKGWGTWLGYYPESVTTDRNGRFRVESLLPSYEFRLSDGVNELPLGAHRAGEVKGLGDVRLRRAKE